MQAAINDDAMGAPQSVVGYYKRAWGFLASPLHGQLFAPHRPSLVKDRMAGKTAQFAPVPVLQPGNWRWCPG